MYAASNVVAADADGVEGAANVIPHTVCATNYIASAAVHTDSTTAGDDTVDYDASSCNW